MISAYRIGLLPGDGIGPEVIGQAVKVLQTLRSLLGFEFELVKLPWSSQHYLDTGKLPTSADLEEMRKLDAILLGALGDPRVERGLMERSVLLMIRFGLDLYINLRPVVLYTERLTPLKGVGPDDIDMVVVRENTEDAYAGIGGALRPGTAHEIAVAEMIYTRPGIERTVRYAFELARTRGKKRRVTLVDKSNAIRAQEIWRRVFDAVSQDFPDVSTDAVYVDAAAMYLVTDPRRFDVIVTTNLFGDILTDLGAAIQGGLGSAASGNIHPGQVSMFEPIHGSAPDIAGQNLASPVGAVAAVGMMLDYLGEREAAHLVDDAIRALLVSGRIPSVDARSGLSTEEAGDLMVQEVKTLAGERSAAPQ